MNKDHAISFLKTFKNIYPTVTEDVYFHVDNYGNRLSTDFEFEGSLYQYNTRCIEYKYAFFTDLLNANLLNIIGGIPIKSRASIISIADISAESDKHRISITLAIATKSLT